MKKVDLILSVAGARGDFIDAWLSTLTDYNNKTWFMDEMTGKTSVCPTLRRIETNSEINLIDDLEKIFKEHSLDESKIFSSGMHATNLIKQLPKKILCDVNYQIRFILVTFKEHSCLKIHWEMIIKNYLPILLSKIEVKQNVSIEKIFTERLNKKNVSYLKTFHRSIVNQLKLLGVNTIEIEYEEIIKPSGSYYLEKKLNLNVTENDHKYWKTQLEKSFAPLEVECSGKIFKYEELL